MTQDSLGSQPLRVMLADDHVLFREGIRSLLNGRDDTEVVGEAGDGAEAIAMARQLRPDVVVMDIGMPGTNGLESSRQITREMPEIKVVFLTMHASDNYFFEALLSGASGYVLKSAAFTDLQMALEATRRGEVFLYPSLARKLVQDYQKRMASGEERSAFDNLSPREAEVFQLIAEGYTGQETADRLHISVNTVQTHRMHIMDKLNLHSRAELMKYAIRMGLVAQSSSEQI